MIAKASEVDTRAAERPVLPDVVLEHLEEYALLSIQRRKLLFSEEVTLGQFHEHDERIAAHRDGLALAVPESVELAVGRLDEPDPWDVYAAAMVWMELGDPASEAVVEKIAGAEDELPAAWREALRRVASDTLVRLLPGSLLRDGPAEVQSALIYGCGWHGTLPRDDIPGLVTSEHAAVRYSLARAIGWGETAVPGAKEILRILGDDPDSRVRRAALWSGALVDPDSACGLCRNRIRSGDADVFDVRVLGLLGGAADLDLLADAPESEALDTMSFSQGTDSGATEETMGSMWRRSLLAVDPETKWIRREVPDGFFSAEPEPTAVPGE